MAAERYPLLSRQAQQDADTDTDIDMPDAAQQQPPPKQQPPTNSPSHPQNHAQQHIEPQSQPHSQIQTHQPDNNGDQPEQQPAAPQQPNEQQQPEPEPTPAPAPAQQQDQPPPSEPPTQDQEPQQQQEEEEEEQEEDENEPTPTPIPTPDPGPRAQRLKALFETTAKHTLDKISKDNFEACFPTVAAKAPGTLEFVQRQMVGRLGGLWTREFETIMANRQVVARLNELETLVGDATRRRLEAGGAGPPVAPHTLPAPTILHAHLAPHLASNQSQLNAALQNTQASNAQLWDEIQAQRAEMEALVGGVEKVLRDMDGANALLGEVVDEVAVETRAAEGDIEAVRGRVG